MNLVLMAVHRHNNGWTASRFAVEPNLTLEEGPMIVSSRIAVVLLVCVAVSSSVIAQEKPKIFLGASSKTLGYSHSGWAREKVSSINRVWTLRLFSCGGCR